MKARALRRVLWGVLGAPALAVVAILLLAWEPTLAPLGAATPDRFAPAVIRRGAQLASLGACAECHTSPEGAPFSGGRAIPTPFGSVQSSNLTPDPTTGIGAWSVEAFRRAMRAGIDREGDQLYPAFPYEHFTLLTDSDIDALYAFLMTREAVHATPPENHLSGLAQFRPLLAVWKLLFLQRGPRAPDAARDGAWNRGAYLVNGISHCGSCHTPRNDLGAEVRSEPLAGATVDGWNAFALDSHSPASRRWDSRSFYQYLRHGWDESHGVAYGPMATVIAGLAAASESDLQAMVTYLASLQPDLKPPDPGRGRGSSAEARSATAEPGTVGPAAQPADVEAQGAAIYASACADCHDGSRPLPYGGLPLALSSAVTGPEVNNLAALVLQGIQPPPGAAGAIMPGFAATLTDGQMQSLLAFIRLRFGARPPWNGVDASLRQARARLQHE